VNNDGSKLLALHDSDNVYVALGAVSAGTVATSDDQMVRVLSPVTLGHKIARRAIAPGEPILKYGVCIGRATQAIPVGAHVHVHNVRSDYTATHLLQETAKGDADA